MTDPIALSLAATLIRHFEGCSLTPIPDTPPHWQVGYGMNYLPDGSAVTADTPAITPEEAESMLMTRLSALAAHIDGLTPTTLLPNQRAALWSFAWNEGEGALAGSTLLKNVQLGNTGNAATQFGGWVYAGGRVNDGLVSRRAVERDVFLGRLPDWAR